MNESHQNSFIPQASKGVRSKPAFCRLLEPRAILFGFVVLHLLVILIYDMRFGRENAFAVSAGWSPVAAIIWPLLLVVGSVCLLIGRPLTQALAVLISVRLMYVAGYLGLVGISNAHDTAMLSPETLMLWFQITPTTLLVQTALASVMLIIGIIELSRLARTNRKRRAWLPDKNTDPDLKTIS